MALQKELQFIQMVSRMTDPCNRIAIHSSGHSNDWPFQWSIAWL